MTDIDLAKMQCTRAIYRQTKDTDLAAAKTDSPIPHAIVQRVLADPHTLQSTDLLYLQRTIGNRAASQMVRGGGSPLRVGAGDDSFEQEANRVSEQISGARQGRSVQRSETEAQVGAEGGAVSRDLERRIQRARGGGSHAPEGVRRAMKEKTGADFGNVRVHDDKEADSISSELGAKAATYGRDIFLARDQSPHDIQLMAHELTHTVQQGAVKAAGEHTPVQNSGLKAPAIQLKKSKFKKWVNRNKNNNSQSSYRHNQKRLKQLQELTDEQLKKGQISKTVGFHALKVFQEILLLPVSIIDHLTVLDLHLKDFFNFLSSGKTREKNEKGKAKKEKRLRKRHYQQELKRVKKLKGDNYTAKDFKKFNPLSTSQNERVGNFKRHVGRSGLRGYLTGQDSHKFMYGGTSNIAMEGVLNSEFNPLKQLTWGGKDLKTEIHMHKQERKKRAKPPLQPNGNDNVQDDNVQDNTVQDNNVQTVNGQVDNLNDVQHEDDTGLTSEVGGNFDSGSDSELEFIRNLFEVEAEIEKETEENQTNDG